MSTPTQAVKTGPAPIANTLSFDIGKDSFGHWVALELHGRGGGFFRTEQDAVRYAMAECAGSRQAVRVVHRPLRLPL